MYARSAPGQAVVNVKSMNNLNKNSSAADIAARIAAAATRANAEAEARRAAEVPHNLPPEKGGPKGPEPTRYGDWEKKGLISDF